ncbi:amino acid deaminase [Nocardia concava]|uniref:amino acid deaminase n=1 Tax=Nocardia concava TaxID=257281 RepID=UPI0002DDAC1D|nr:amino acid deaminase [Nocardia concava]
MAADNAVAAPGETVAAPQGTGLADTVGAVPDLVLGPQHKSLPPAAWGLTVREYLATAPHLDDLQTPVLTMDRAALDTNRAVMAEWASAAGVRLAPHGKTTMSPQLWKEQLDAGSWAITLATGWQVQVGRSLGLNRILLANALLDPTALRWVAAEIARDPNFELYSWVDGVASVREMERHLESAPDGVKLNVIVELGGPHGRTGARGLAAAHEVADAVDKSPRLRLAGVGGYEGALAHDRTPEALAAVRHYLDQVAILHQELAAAGRYDEFLEQPAARADDTSPRHSGASLAGIHSAAVDPGQKHAGMTGGSVAAGLRESMSGERGASGTGGLREAAVGAGGRSASRTAGQASPHREGRATIVTAGGSAYPDLVVERLGGLADEAGAHGVPTAVVLRSGAYLVHDDGFYSGISPLAAGHAERPLRSAMHGWARSVSRPEAELALLDAGKRDFPFDEGLPVPQLVAGPASKPLPDGAHVSALNDQHTFLRLPGGSEADVPVGSVVRLGLSHPCTAFDKWRLIPVIDDAEAERPRIVDFLPTYF